MPGSHELPSQHGEEDHQLSVDKKLDDILQRVKRVESVLIPIEVDLLIDVSEPSKEPQDLTTEAKFIQAWHSFTSKQRARLFPHLKATVLTLDDIKSKEFLSVPETAILLGISQGRIRALIKEGKISASQDPLGRHIISKDFLETYHPLPIGGQLSKRTIKD